MADERLTVWEVAQHLIARLECSSEIDAADLLLKVGGGMGDRARRLAYLLYQIADRKGWIRRCGRLQPAHPSAWHDIERRCRCRARGRWRRLLT